MIRPGPVVVGGEDSTGRPPEGEAVVVRPLVVAIVAAMWVVVLAPPLLRSWSRDRRSASAIGARPRLRPTRYPDTPRRRFGADLTQRPRDFRANAPTEGSLLPPERSRAVRTAVRCRRRNVLFAFVVTISVTAVGGFGWGSAILVAVNVFADGFFVLYVVLLVRLRRAEERRAMWELWSRAA